jgi:hypothetical protein
MTLPYSRSPVKKFQPIGKASPTASSTLLTRRAASFSATGLEMLIHSKD